MAVWKKIWFSQAQLVSSWSSDADGARAGQFWAVTFADRTGRNYGNHFELLGATPRFATRSGFINRVDFVQARVANRFTWYGRPGALVEQVTTFIVLLPLWRYDDFFRLRGIFEGGPQMTWTATLRGGWNLNTVVANGAQRFAREAYAGFGVDRTADTIPFAVPHGLYNLWSVNGGVGTPNRAFTFTANVGYGATAIFAEAAAGRQLVVQATAGWKPTPAVRIEGRWVHVRLTRARDGSRFSTANIPRLKLEYQLSRAVFFRYVGQYVAQDQVALEDLRTGQPLVVNGRGAAAVLTRFAPVSWWLIVGFAAVFAAVNFAMYRITRDTPFRPGYAHVNIAIGSGLISTVLCALGPTGHVLYAVYLIAPLEAAWYLGSTEAWQAVALNLTGFGLATALRGQWAIGAGACSCRSRSGWRSPASCWSPCSPRSRAVCERRARRWRRWSTAI